MEHFFPEILITYLLPFRQAFSQPGFAYFQGFIVGLLLLNGRKTVTRIASACFFIDKSLASWERFLADAKWSLPRVTERLIALIFTQLGHQLLYAGYYLLGIDTTYVKKSPGQMLGVQRWTENGGKSQSRTTVVGHQWAIAGFLHRIGHRWQALPVISRLISGQSCPSHVVVNASGQARRQCFWDAVIAVVLQVATYVTTAPLCVVCDAYFSKAPFLNSLMDWGIAVVSRLRWDAVGFDDPIYGGRGRPPKRGKPWKLAELLQETATQTVRATIYRQTVALTVVVRDVWLREVKQKVRVVVIATKEKPLVLVSTTLAFTAKQIIEIYAARFALELSIRDLKQHVGFCDYQATTTAAFHRFVQLCCCALSIGRLILCQAASLSWLTDSQTAVSESPLSFPKLRRCLRGYVMRRLLFSKSAGRADSEKSERELEAIVRLAA